MLSSLLVISTAQAGASDELDWMRNRYEFEPAMGLVCSPVGPVVDFLAKVPLPPAVLEGAGSSERGAALLELLARDKAVAAGLDLDGGLLVALGPKVGDGEPPVVFSVPFSGSHDQADALLQRVVGSAYLRPDGASWWGIDKAGKDQVQFAQEGARLIGVNAAGAQPQGAASSPSLATFPAGAGCALVFDPSKLGTSTDATDKLADMKVAAFFPFTKGDPAVIRMAVDKPAPGAFAKAEVVPRVGSSTTKPSILVLVDTSLTTLAGLIPEGKAKGAEAIEKLGRVARLDGGVALAVYGDPREQHIVAAVPIADPDGGPLKAKKILKLSGKIPGTKKTSKTTWETRVADRIFFGEAADGVAAFGFDPVVVHEAVAGVGTPWVDDKLAAEASAWPVAVRADANGANLAAGIRSVDGAWEMQFSMHPDASVDSSQMAASMLGMIAAIGVPNFVKYQRQAKLAEVETTLGALDTAEASYFSAHQTYMALPVSPRPLESLSAARVVWTASPEWAALDWSPSGSEFYGVYWVELGTDGMATIHAMIDTDGDGNPAHYARVVGHSTEQLTDPSVF